MPPLKALQHESNYLSGACSCVFIFVTQEHCSPVLPPHPPALLRAAVQTTVTQTWRSVSTDPPLPLNPLWVGHRMLTSRPNAAMYVETLAGSQPEGSCGVEVLDGSVTLDECSLVDGKNVLFLF